MSETPLPPGIVPPPTQKPVPFFKTVDFTKRPKWEVSQLCANEILRIMQAASESDNKNEYLARQLKTQYGEEEAIEILENVQKHMKDSIVRSSYKDTEPFKQCIEHAKIARGILGTPNWKDPDKQPPPIRFSAK